MKQLLLKWLLKDVTRFEIINHENVEYKIGRILSHKKRNIHHYSYKLSSSLQDDNKTLKIFI